MGRVFRLLCGRELDFTMFIFRGVIVVSDYAQGFVQLEDALSPKRFIFVLKILRSGEIK